MPTKPTKSFVSLPVSDFDRDFLFACRYAYYCLGRNIVTDQHYDELEKRYKLEHGEAKLPVGSDKKEDYTEAQRSLTMYFLFSARSVTPVDMNQTKKFF